MGTWYSLLEKMQDILFPLYHCTLCHQAGYFDSQHPWCADCEAQWLEEMQEENQCAICQKEIPQGQTLCLSCAEHVPPFTRAVHLAPYGGKMEEAIKALKYHNQKVLVPQLGRMMAAKLRTTPEFSACEVIVPVPLFPKKQIERGFNQSALLAKQLARELGWHVDLSALVRVKETPSQTALNRREREENVRDAFRVCSDQLKGKTVLLLDDVLTTGATVRSCAQALMQSGVKAVYVMTLAAVSQMKEKDAVK